MAQKNAKNNKNVRNKLRKARKEKKEQRKKAAALKHSVSEVVHAENVAKLFHEEILELNVMDILFLSSILTDIFEKFKKEFGIAVNMSPDDLPNASRIDKIILRCFNDLKKMHTDLLSALKEAQGKFKPNIDSYEETIGEICVANAQPNPKFSKTLNVNVFVGIPILASLSIVPGSKDLMPHITSEEDKIIAQLIDTSKDTLYKKSQKFCDLEACKDIHQNPKSINDKIDKLATLFQFRF